MGPRVLGRNFSGKSTVPWTTSRPCRDQGDGDGDGDGDRNGEKGSDTDIDGDGDRDGDGDGDGDGNALRYIVSRWWR